LFLGTDIQAEASTHTEIHNYRLALIGMNSERQYAVTVFS